MSAAQSIVECRERSHYITGRGARVKLLCERNTPWVLGEWHGPIRRHSPEAGVAAALPLASGGELQDTDTLDQTRGLQCV